MNQTSIEWCDFTVNPIRLRNTETGKVGHYCEKVSPGCKNCYASRMQKGPYLSGLEFRAENREKGELFFDDSVLQRVLRRRKPATIFWVDMSDLFGDWVPDEWIDRCAAVVALTPHLRHPWLTKRARRMREYFEGLGYGFMSSRISSAAFDLMPLNDLRRIQWNLPGWPLPNLGLGVSVEDQATADERIPDLLATPAAMRFVSLEPMLSDVVLDADWMYPRCRYCGRHSKRRLPQCEFSDCAQDFDGREHRLLDWVICGGESGPGARPMHPDWVRSIRDQCVAAGVPFLFKQWGEWQNGSYGDHTKDRIVLNDGRVLKTTEDLSLCPHTVNHWVDFRPCIMAPVGKRAAGRRLDGQVWGQRPDGWRG